jgi:endoglucanase
MQDTDGGVFHKQTSTHFCAFIMPEADKLPSAVIGTGQEPFKSSCATADTAAVAAIAARLFKPYDPSYSAHILAAAENAWTWVEKNPGVTFHNPKGVTTGDYGDPDCSDEHLWAAAELWRTTHKPVYEQYFLAHYRDFLQYLRPVGPQSWGQVSPLALWTYVLGNGSDREAAGAIRKASIAAADQIVARTATTGYRVSLTTRDYIWGSNGVAANYSMQLLIANQLQPNPLYFQTAVDNLHYILGRNTFSLSWVTHVGQHAFQHPHHRPSGADGLDQPWPGLMSGGPNPGRQDSAMKRFVSADTKPARAYIDMTPAYACNEIAINWNAPLVFALAATVLP